MPFVLFAAVDIQKHLDYWRSGAEEDMAAAGSLLEKKHPRHALFFAHLAVEKMPTPGSRKRGR